MATVLWAKIIIAVSLGLLAIPAFFKPLNHQLMKSSPIRLSLVFLLTRLSAFCVVFVIAGIRVPTDILAYFYPQAVLVNNGQIPIQDFETSYNIGFPALLSLATAIYDSPLAVMVLMIMAEALAFYLIADLSSRFLEKAYHRVLTLWLINPLSFIFIALGGQDEALVVLIVSAACWCMWQGWRNGIAIILVSGFLVTKIITLMVFVVGLAFPMKKIYRAMLPLLAISIGLLIFSSTLDFPLVGAKNEVGNITSGNIWAVLMLINPDWPAGESWQYFLFPLVFLPLLIFSLFGRRDEPDKIMRLWALVGAVFMMTSPKSFGMYAVMFMPGFLFVADCSRQLQRLFLLIVFFPLLVIEQALWFYLGGQNALSSPWLMIIADLFLLFGHALIVLNSLGGRGKGKVEQTSPQRFLLEAPSR